MSTKTVSTDILNHWQTVADSVSFDSTATIDSFNREIHQAIMAHSIEQPDLARDLLSIKFQLNKRYYDQKKRGPQ